MNTVHCNRRSQKNLRNKEAIGISLAHLAFCHFGPISTAEKVMLEAAEAGKIADIASLPASVESSIRADVLRWLCVAKSARDRMDSKGTQLSNARITGRLDLESVVSTLPLRLNQCLLPSGISLRNATFPFIDLSGSTSGDIDADNLVCAGSLMLKKGFRCNGTFLLRGARIGGNLDFDSARLVNPAGESLTLMHTIIGGSVLLRNGFRALGQVRIHGGSIGVLQCDAGRFAARRDFALVIESVRIQNALLLRKPRKLGSLPFRALGGIRLYGSSINGNVELTGAIIKCKKRETIKASYLKVGGTVFVNDGFVSHGKVDFYCSQIDSDFIASGALFLNPNGPTLALSNPTIGGCIFFAGIRSLGTIRIVGGSVGGIISCEGGRFAARKDFALTIESVKIKQAVLLRRKNNKMHGRRFRAVGGIRLYNSAIGGNLEMTGAIILAQRREALQGAYLKINGSAFLGGGFIATGKLNLYASEISTDLLAVGARLNNSNGLAVDISTSRVKGHVVFKEATVIGKIEACNASVGGNIDFGRAILESQKGSSISAINIEVGTNVYLNQNFHSIGAVDFSNAKVGSDFDCTSSKFKNPDRVSLTLDRARVAGNLLLADTNCAGKVILAKASIGGDFNCSKAVLSNSKGTSLAASWLRVAGSTLMGQGFKSDGVVDLRDATIARIEDEEDCWPVAGKLKIDGLTYERINLITADLRLRWLQRQWESGKYQSQHFLAQPYEQLIQTMRKNGHEKEARKVAIAKQKALCKSGTLPGGVKLLHEFYGLTMHYGYRPQRSLLFAPVFVFGLALALNQGGSSLVIPTKAREASSQVAKTMKIYPSFNSFAYALDTFVPIINLQQKDYWQPDDQACCSEGPAKCGKFLRWYLWIHTIFGWIITTLAVAGFTGLVRKD